MSPIQRSAEPQFIKSGVRAVTSVENWRLVVIQPCATIMDAITVIDKGALRVALVVDEQYHLLGVVTDGDVRRALLSRVDLSESVTQVMCSQPFVAYVSDSHEKIFSLMNAKTIEHIPVLSEDGTLVGLKTLREMARPQTRDNWVVLMAGGLGSRLGPLTKECPKPMLKVGVKPILQLIIESYIAHGYYRFYISVNYKKEIIQNYFGNGSDWGVEIRYLEEEGRLGTAGSLALLPEIPSEPFFVMNGDLLTRINFNDILEFHLEHNSKATLCVRKMEQTIPYGVVQTKQHQLLGIEEKPVQSYFVNAGIYLLDPSVLPFLSGANNFDMPDLFRRVIEKGHETAAFPFLDYWLDIGQRGDFHQACEDVSSVFQ
ncbi:MAG: nucleotidyltransferase family protein [Magnetococcales bacterium]|nr:nucleotidyltransferase family protein [Magnetococcales bacterium]